MTLARIYAAKAMETVELAARRGDRGGGGGRHAADADGDPAAAGEA